MMRLFIGLPVEKRVQKELGQITSVLNTKGGKVKWVKPKLIHLTVRFLGDTDEGLIGDLSKLIDRVAAQTQTIGTIVDSLGGFPNLNRPRVIWAGLSGATEVLTKVAGEVERSVRELGFKAESNRFKAHLTIGRVRDPRPLGTLPDYIKSFEMRPLELTFDRLILYKSTLTPEGPIYEHLHVANLGEERLGG
jgi:2'-5' RNA ligase